MTDEQLVRRAGGALALADVKRLSYMPSWSDVPVDQMKAFCLACGVDFANPARMKSLNRYLRNAPKWLHVRRDSNFNQYRSMLAEYLNFESRRAA